MKIKRCNFLKNFCFKVVLTGIILSFMCAQIRSATIVNQRIGCLDMNRLLEESTYAQDIKAEMLGDLLTRKENIKTCQADISSLESEIKVMAEKLDEYEKARLNAYNVGASTASEQQQRDSVLPEVSSDTVNTEIIDSTSSVQVEVSSPAFTADEIEIKKKDLIAKKLDLEQYISATASEEKNIARKIKRNLLGKIYDAIKEVVEEEGLTVVLDSSNVVYDDGVIDITQQVLKRLKK